MQEKVRFESSSGVTLSGVLHTLNAGRPFQIRKDFVDDVRSQSVRDGIRSLRKALLVMNSPIDELVPSPCNSIVQGYSDNPSI
jgi:hypothetical protein